MQVSDADRDLLLFCWSLDKDGYVVRKEGEKNIKQHVIILERDLGRKLLADETVDHIDRNKANNRRNNLRVASRSENQHNRGIQSNNKSGYKGVSYCSTTGRWQSHISANGVNYNLGRYDTPELAALAYNRKARELHKDFAYQNDLGGHNVVSKK